MISLQIKIITYLKIKNEKINRMSLIAETFSHIVLSHRKTVTLNIFLSVLMRSTILIYNMGHLMVSLLKETRQGSDNYAHRLRLLFLYFGEFFHKRVHVCYLFFDSSQRCPSSSISSSSCSLFLALFRGFFHSVRPSWLVSCPAATVSLASLMVAAELELAPSSASLRRITASLQPRTMSISS